MDFKGLKHPRVPYEALSAIDDSSRFCLGLLPVADQSLESVWDALWAMLGIYGLPDALLTDNGPSFRSGAGKLPSALAVRLMKLGISHYNGRPHHPQTQGKVERFHGTLERELGPRLRQPSRDLALQVYEDFRNRYNWERPHEALGLVAPGSIYHRSSRTRPCLLPEQEIPEGALSRKVDGCGNISFRSMRYRLGRGLAGEWVALREEEDGEFAVLFFDMIIGRLQDFRV